MKFKLVQHMGGMDEEFMSPWKESNNLYQLINLKKSINLEVGSKRYKYSYLKGN